jgi:hypothetical protein
MSPEENERLHKEAVHAACQVLGIPPEEEFEWHISLRNLWRERDDGLYEWCGKSCPPTPADGSWPYRYVRDEARACWVAIMLSEDEYRALPQQKCYGCGVKLKNNIAVRLKGQYLCAECASWHTQIPLDHPILTETK